MFVLAMMIQAAVSPSAVTGTTGNDVVVSGQGTAEKRKALAQCIADHCAPDKEISTAIGLASKEFIDGDYAGARSTLLKTRERNARYAARYPKPVSDLHRAIAGISRLDGRQFSARAATFDATDALKAAPVPDGKAVFLQRLETGNQLGFEGKISDAIRLYDDVARDARRLNYTNIEGRAMFEAAVLYAAAASVDFQYRGAAQFRAKQIEKRQEPEFAEFREGLILLKAKLASLSVRNADRSKAIAATNLPRVEDAILLSEPLPKYIGTTSGLSGSTSNAPEWADVAFWVRPDGSVSEPKLLGQSAQAPGPWLAVKMKAVGQRRYAPLNRPADDAGLYVVERYSMVHDIQSKTGSTMLQRSVDGTLVTTDITSARIKPGSMM